MSYDEADRIMLDEFLEIEVLSGVSIRIPKTHENIYTQFEKFSVDHIKKYLRQEKSYQ